MSAAARSGTLEEGQVRAMFDRIAGPYDLMNSVMTAGLHHRWRERAADLARVGPGSRALDVATGTGDLAIELASRGAAVVGSDFSEGMLEVARSKAPELRWEHGNALALPYEDGAFDAATVGFGARNFSDLDAGCARWRASCGPAGASWCWRSRRRRTRRCRRSSPSGSTASCRCWASWRPSPRPTPTCRAR